MSVLELLVRDNKAYSLLTYNFHEEYKLIDDYQSNDSISFT